MKTISLFILLLLSGMLTAQTIDNPTFKARTGSIDNISRIERTPESTRVYIHAIFRPHWWIMVKGLSCLEDADTGKKYKFKGVEGIELNKKVYMPDSGTMDYVVLYEPLPKETRTIHLLDADGTENNTYDISLIPQKSSPLEDIKGNWFSANQPGKWEYGIYDSITIMHNRIYKNESVRKKGKRIELTVKDSHNGATSTVLLTPQKDKSCKISTDGMDEYLYTKERSSQPVVTADNGYQEFFRKDSACLQGYINGYDPRLGFETGLIYLSDVLSRNDYPTVIAIRPDGSFQCKFQINHPMCQSATIQNAWIPFYIEPGQTLTMYLDWEDILAKNRSRDWLFPLSHTAYMGPCASLSYLATSLNRLFTYDYEDMSKSRDVLTPNQYKERLRPFTAQLKQTADSLNRLYQPSGKATRLIQNTATQKTGEVLFEFLLGRDFYAKLDTANQALKVQEDESYYDFLKELPRHDETMLAITGTETFINRFEYMNPLQKAYTNESHIVITSKSQQEIDQARAAVNTDIRHRKDSIIQRICGEPDFFFWQIAKVRNLKFELENIKNDQIARQYVEELKKEITYPILVATAEEMLQKIHPEEGNATYRLPEGKATEIFRNIIKNHPGKTLFVDFWATTCGPCRAGIESTADLRKKYKNHPEFQFIYITGERDSPKGAYQNYVEAHLKGEACYYVTDTEFNYLRQLFQFNGIPHYELVEKDGSIAKGDLSSHNIGSYLEQRFHTPDNENLPDK